MLGPALTVALYALFWLVHRRRRTLATLPVVAVTVVLIVLLAATTADRLGDLDAFERGTAPIGWLLGPSTVALAVPLARRRELLRQHLRAIGAVAFGALLGVASAWGLARALRLSPAMVATLTPKSVTTPIAMPISERLGGIPTLTAAIVVVTGVLGAAFGPPLLDLMRVRDPVARGVALGTAAHGVGTSRAIGEGELQGASAGVAMVVAGIVTAIVAPLFFR